jgi:hypothetical protein
MSGVMLSGAGTVTAGGGCACATTRNSCTGDDGSSINFCYYAENISVAAQFTAAASKKICKASLRLKKDGDTGNNPTIKYCIYSDDGGTPGKPNAIIGTCSNTMNVNSLTTSFTDVMLTGMDVDITNGTLYHIVVTSSAQCTNNLIRWGFGTSDCPAGSNGPQTWGTITPVWTNSTSNSNLEYTLYSCD